MRKLKLYSVCSTIVSLKAEFVKTLSVGKHTISIVSTTGLADTEFTVIKASTSVIPGTNSTQTGDSSNMGMWIALFMISAGGAFVLLLKRKKLKNK